MPLALLRAYRSPGGVGCSGGKAKGAGIQQLNDFQRKHIEQLARDKGITCEFCGSAELRSEGNAHPYIDKHFGIDLWCTNASAHPATIRA